MQFFLLGFLGTMGALGASVGLGNRTSDDSSDTKSLLSPPVLDKQLQQAVMQANSNQASRENGEGAVNQAETAPTSRQPATDDNQTADSRFDNIQIGGLASTDAPDTTTDTGGNAGTDETAPDFVIEPAPADIGGNVVEISAEATPETSGAFFQNSDTLFNDRVYHIEIDDADVTGVRILEQPDFGHVSVNPDLSLSLVLTGNEEVGQIDYSFELTRSDGSTDTVTNSHTLEDSLQESGWGEGRYYMLETDEQGDVVVEHGMNHRKIYVSGDEEALSLTDIAVLEGIDVSQVTAGFLRANPEYGGSEDMALAEDAGAELWFLVSDGEKAGANSNWLLFERGYEYEDFGRLIPRGATGESELNPMMIGAWGEGEKPVITSVARAYQADTENVVIQDLHLSGIKILNNSENWLFDDVTITGGELNAQRVDGLTVHNSAIYDVYHDNTTKQDDDGLWSPAADRTSGIFVRSSDNILITGTFLDHNGWADDYDYNLSEEGGHPPSFYSHNVYLQYDNTDVTFTDNISMRAASFGAQLRSGGYVEDNIFIDNNAGLLVMGGDYKDRGDVGNYSLLHDNVITSAGYKTVAKSEGSVSQGLSLQGQLTSLDGNVIAHLADPNNPDELEEKYLNNRAIRQENGTETYFDDTRTYNWLSGRNFEAAMEDGIAFEDVRDYYSSLDPSIDRDEVLNTTIQNLTAQITGGDSATIDGLADYLRAIYATETPEDYLTAEEMVAYFKDGFDATEGTRAEAATLRFIPNDLGDGVRWDNRLNWTGESTPGEFEGDSADLGGNRVVANVTAELENLSFGAGGSLEVTSGKLSVNNGLDVSTGGADVGIDGAGQFWINGYDDTDVLSIDAEGGRFANTGNITGGMEITVRDNAQVLLATGESAFAPLEGASSLTIIGDDARVGVDSDGSGPSVINLGSDFTLRFEAEDGGMGTLEEIYSGAFPRTQNAQVESAINFNDANLELDVAGLDAGRYNLVDLDEMRGVFDNVSVENIGAGRGANLIYDYEDDLLMLDISENGTGELMINMVGNEDDFRANAELWDRLAEAEEMQDEVGF